MNFKKALIALGFLMTLQAPVLFAQTTDMIESVETAEVNKNVSFNVVGPATTDTENQFIWDFGDGSAGSGLSIPHTFIKPGHYEISVTIKNEQVTSPKISKTLFVYDQIQTFLVNKQTNNQELFALSKALQQKHIHIQFLNIEDEWNHEEVLLLEKSQFVFTNIPPSGLVATANNAYLKDSTLVTVTDHPLHTLERLSKTSFSNIGAAKIILTQSAALTQDGQNPSLLEAQNDAELSGILINRELPMIQVDTQERVGFGNFTLAITNYLRSKGIEDISLFLLLSIPIIVTLISFFRQFVGIATLGLYAPMVFTLIFLIVGAVAGSVTFVLVVFFSILLQRVLHKIRVMYVPKMAMILIGLTLVMLGGLFMSVYFDLDTIIGIEIFPLIFLVTMGERFISLKLERGLKSASILYFETILVAMIIYVALITSKEYILAYPEIIFLMIPINYLIGKWTGLRISELLRFRELIDTIEQDS